MTGRLYEQYPYMRQFMSVVTGCVQEKDRWAVTLDRTAFYPEGGGQPGDTGVIGEVQVVDTHESHGEVLHYTTAPLEVGRTVEGQIDWQERFSRMQNHTGEHIVSGWVHQLFGLDNVGFHMGREAVTLDFNGELTPEQLAHVEHFSNRSVYDNLEVEVTYPTPQELETISYRSKKALEGTVRIVTIPGCDICACCGTHLKMTGEIGAIKLLSAQRYKGGVRVSILCGERAMTDYEEKNARSAALSAMLSTKPGGILQAVQRLLDENAALGQTNAALQGELFKRKAEQIPLDTRQVCLFEENLTPDGLGKLCMAVCTRCQAAAVFSGSAKAGWKYALGSQQLDIRPLGKLLNTAFAGRGGGSRELVQGALTTGTQAQLHAFFENNQPPLENTCLP